MDITDKKAIDLLVNEFWRLGFFTISRRLGTFLPEPDYVGKYQVDVIGRQNEKYAIGIFLTKEDIFKSDLLEKISYLASRKSRATGKSITLLIGVNNYYFKRVKELLLNIDDKIRRNIKLVRIEENNIGAQERSSQPHQMIFS
jgi:hypothetical protein